ncbi:hypothetical protein, partial [Phocaeicola vulgatus]|uniref:hypothetical protein n=1 Tax=Phocaeicola vulgatus TaxID=821 RepID=UPI000E4FCD14
MSKGKLWGIILLILFVLGFGIWLYTSSDVKKDVDQEGIGVLDDMTIPGTFIKYYKISQLIHTQS